MFERFTQDARSVVRNAVAEAERRGDRHTGTEHLVLAAVASANRITASIMDAAGIDLQRTRRALDETDDRALAAIGVDVDALAAKAGANLDRQRRPGRRVWRLPFTAGAKQALEGALRHALELNDRHIGSEHILLALTARPAPDPGQQLLSAVGVDHTDLHLRIREALRRAA